MSFAKELQRLMRKRRLTASNLAARIWGRYVNTEGKNVARGRDRISVWLAGKSVPSEKNLAKLAEALQIEIWDLEPRRGRIPWGRNRMAAWMHDHCLDGEEPYQ
jgi:transcriptional regulator with XRE-family HTH domain